MTDAETIIRNALDGKFFKVAHDGTTSAQTVPLDWCPDYERLMRTPSPAENGAMGRAIGGGRPRLQWSDEVTARFIAMRLQRQPIAVIAAAFGCSVSACTKYWEKLRDQGLV